MNNKKFLSLVLSLVMVLGTFTSVFAASEPVKKDEKTTETKVEKVEKITGKDNKIQYIIDKKFVEGYEDGDYGYDKNIKRSEITKLLVFANGHKELSEKLQGSMKVYSDVDTTFWANGVITVGTTVPSSSNNQAMLNGYPTGKFLPERNVTYAELAKMLVVLAKEDLTADMVKTANKNWAAQWMTWAAELGILDDVTVANSDAFATRADAFTMLYNALYKMQEFKRVPANEKLGILSELDNKELTLNQDKDEKYTITNDTVIILEEKDNKGGNEDQIVKVSSLKNPEYYIGSLVRLMYNDKKEITHILELGNPEKGALGLKAAKENTLVNDENDRWEGIADNTISTYMNKDIKSLKDIKDGKYDDKKIESYATIKLDNDEEVDKILFHAKDEKAIEFNIDDDTRIFVANPGNNQTKEVKDADEALSLLGVRDVEDKVIPNVYAAYDDDVITTATGNKYSDADLKVLVFNIVTKDNDKSELYRVLESSSSKGVSILEDVDGEKYDYDFFDNKGSFPYNYGDKYDVIEVKYRASKNGYEITKELDHSETDDYPIVEITKVRKDGKYVEIKDYKGREALIDLTDADVFTGKLSKLEKGDVIQIKVDDKAKNTIDIVSILPDDTDLEGSIYKLLNNVNSDRKVGKLLSVGKDTARFEFYESIFDNKVVDEYSVNVDIDTKDLEKYKGETFTFLEKENDNNSTGYLATDFNIVVDGKEINFNDYMASMDAAAKKALEDAIAKAEKLVEDNKDVVGTDKLNAAIATAKEILADEKTTTKGFNDAVTTLETAIEEFEKEVAKAEKPTITVTKANNKTSVSIKFNDGRTISDINSLTVSLLNKNGNVLSTNTLNELGFFLNGNEKGTQDSRYTKMITASNLEHYKTLLKDDTLAVGDLIEVPADGDFDKISTSFIYGNPAFDGMDDKANLSSWDKGAVPAGATVAKVLVTIDGVDFEVEVK